MIIRKCTLHCVDWSLATNSSTSSRSFPRKSITGHSAVPISNSATRTFCFEIKCVMHLAHILIGQRHVFRVLQITVHLRATTNQEAQSPLSLLMLCKPLCGAIPLTPYYPKLCSRRLRSELPFLQLYHAASDPPPTCLIFLSSSRLPMAANISNQSASSSTMSLSSRLLERRLPALIPRAICPPATIQHIPDTYRNAEMKLK